MTIQQQQSTGGGGNDGGDQLLSLHNQAPPQSLGLHVDSSINSDFAWMKDKKVGRKNNHHRKYKIFFLKKKAYRLDQMIEMT